MVQQLEEQFQAEMGARLNPRQLPPEGNILPTGEQIPPSTPPSLKREQIWNQMLADDPQLAGQTTAGQGITNFFGGLFGGMADTAKRFALDTITPMEPQSYEPMFKPQGIASSLGRGVVEGFTGSYGSGPIDHQNLSPLDQSLFFADLVDPSGVGGDIAKPLFKSIPEGTIAGLAGVMPQRAKDLLIGSKVVDPKGTPTRVYHGTQGVFDEFTPQFQQGTAMHGRGYYFTENPTIAGGYAETKGFTDPSTGQYQVNPNIHATYLNLKNPIYIEGGAQNDVITKMSDKIFSFAKGAPTDAERAADLEGLSNSLFNLGGNYGDPDDFLLDLRLDIDAYDIDKFIANRQWDEAEKGLLEWFKKASNSNYDVFHINNDFFRYRQDPTQQWGKDVWTDGLQELGYDGMTHIGKGGWGQGGAQHRVWIAFDENHIFPYLQMEGTKPELPPSGDFAKMLKDIFGGDIGR